MNAPNQAQLAQVCFARLAHEETYLQERLVALTTVRTAVVGGEQEALAAVWQGEDSALEELRAGRQQFRQAAAPWLRVPVEQVALDCLLPLLTPSDRAIVQASRQRLRGLAQEVQRRAKLCAALVQDFLLILHEVFLNLTGAKTDSGRYGPAGIPQPMACGALIQARG